MGSELNQGKAIDAVGKITRRQLMELDTCAHCALCVDTCPTYSESKALNYSPAVRSALMLRMYERKRGLLSRIFPKEVKQSDVENLADSAFNCTLCGRCMENCPFGLQTHALWMRGRGIIHDLEGNPRNVARLENALAESKNPYGLDADTRLDWAEFAGLDELPRKDKAQVAYFVGCTTAFKGASQDIAASMVTILNRLREDWTVLGEDEWCCGSPLLLAGDEESARAYAEHNVESLVKRGIETVVTSCSGCFRTLKWEYPSLLGRKLPFEVIHAIEYIDEKISSGSLELNPINARVTYHDPCELGRMGGVLEAPRRLLKSFALDYVELPENGLDSRCCGGGGLLQSVNSDLRMKVIKKRLNQVKSSEASILTSGCPACKLAFIDGVKEGGLGIEVIDIVELVARQLKPE